MRYQEGKSVQKETCFLVSFYFIFLFSARPKIRLQKGV